MSSIPPIDSQVGTNITYYGNLGHVNNDKNILVRDACCSVRLAAGGCVGRDCVETVLNCVQTSPAVIGGPPMIITHTKLPPICCDLRAWPLWTPKYRVQFELGTWGVGCQRTLEAKLC